MKNALRFSIIALMLMLSLTTTTVFAQDDVVCESDVFVQHNDSLWKIAQNAYGNGSAYWDIVEATNAKAAMDSSYVTIKNANFIRPGWKLCIPSHSAASASSTPSDEASTAPNLAQVLVPNSLQQT